MTKLELYEVTRGCWKVDVKRAEKADYAFCIYKGIIKEVYKIKEWLPAGKICSFNRIKKNKTHTFSLLKLSL